MNNLQWFYETDEAFRAAVQTAALGLTGSTSLNFTGFWLMEPHKGKGQAEDHTETVEESDSRENLEADVDAWCATFPTWNHADDFREHVFGWLDRQAAITERETKLQELYRFEENHRYHIRSLEETNIKLNARIKEHEEKAVAYGKRISELESIADKYRFDSVEAQKERDAYRDMCGKMRKMANEMLVMEVAEC